MWGTVLPLVSGLAGQERVVDASYYERAAGPLFAVVLALMAAGPLIPWRHAGAPFWRSLRWPSAAFALTIVVLLAAGVRSWPALLGVPLALAVAITVLYEYARAIGRWRRAGGGWPRAVALVARKRRRYGAYLAHLGLAVLVMGLAASHFWQQEKDVTLQPGQQASVAGYTLTYAGVENRELSDHTELVAAMKLGDQTLEPARATYAGLGGQSLTHVAISSSPIADVYVVLAGTNSDGSASFRIFVNPLVTWIWAGGAIIILGVLLGNAGRPRVVVERMPARLPRPVGAQ
jgi:cytochrome c-type biogenesis protein CcmF